MNKINTLCTQTETVFNKINSIPVIALPGSIIRAALGQLQSEIGLVVGVVGLAGKLIQPKDPSWSKISTEGFDHLIHGCFNQLRGAGEFLLAVTIVGPIAPLIYQACSEKDKFGPAFNYETSFFGS